MILQGFGEGMGLILQGLIGWIEGIVGGIVKRPYIPKQITFVPTTRGVSFRSTSSGVSFVTRRK